MTHERLLPKLGAARRRDFLPARRGSWTVLLHDFATECAWHDKKAEAWAGIQTIACDARSGADASDTDAPGQFGWRRMTNGQDRAARIIRRALALFAGEVDSAGRIKAGSYSAARAGLSVLLAMDGQSAAVLTILGFNDEEPDSMTCLKLFEAAWRPGEPIRVATWQDGAWERTFVAHDA